MIFGNITKIAVRSIDFVRINGNVVNILPYYLFYVKKFFKKLLTFSKPYIIIALSDMENQKIPNKVTIKHIAKVAGVSVSTVSRALRNDTTASPKTISRILNIAEKLNYYPDSLAKSLRQKKTNTIGIIFNDLNNPFYTEILSEIGEILNEKIIQ
jgi:transcriptional regulator with XRE-family HTH domain